MSRNGQPEQLVFPAVADMFPPDTTAPLEECELTALAMLWGEVGETTQIPTGHPLVLWGAIPLLIDEVGRLRGVEGYLRAKLAEREELL